MPTTWTDPTDGRSYTVIEVPCALCATMIPGVFADAADRPMLCDACDEELYQRWGRYDPDDHVVEPPAPVTPRWLTWTREHENAKQLA